jgi:hypothetical protein
VPTREILPIALFEHFLAHIQSKFRNRLRLTTSLTPLPFPEEIDGISAMRMIVHGCAPTRGFDLPVDVPESLSMRVADRFGPYYEKRFDERPRPNTAANLTLFCP